MKTKTILFIAAIVGLLGIYSCSSTPTLVGFWTATSIHVNSIDVMNSAPYFTNVKQDIKSDHTFIAYSDYDTTNGTWQSTSTQLTIYMPTDTFVYDYHLNDETHLHMSTTIFGNFSEYEFQK